MRCVPNFAPFSRSAVPSAQLVDVVRAVCGVQAQIITAAELAIGARVPALSEVEGSLTDVAFRRSGRPSRAADRRDRRRDLPCEVPDRREWEAQSKGWERRPRGRRIELRVESFIRLTAAQRRQLEAEAVRIGGFFEAEVALSLGALGGMAVPAPLQTTGCAPPRAGSADDHSRRAAHLIACLAQELAFNGHGSDRQRESK